MRRPFSNNLTELYYKEERSVGSIKPGLMWQRLRMRGESLSQSNVVTEERRMDGTRSVTALTITEQEITGTVNCILSPSDLDIFLEATLRNKWSTLQLSQGNIDRTFSFLLVQSNGVDKQYSLYSGCTVASTTFNFQVNSHVGFELSVIGRKVDHNYALNPAEDLFTPAPSSFFVGLDGVLSADGIEQSFVTSFSGSFGFAHTAIRVIDHENPIRLRTDAFSAEGSLAIAFDGRGVYEEYLNATSFNLTMQVQYNGERYTFIFPKCNVTLFESPSSGIGSIIATADIIPLYSTQHGSAVIVKRATI